jgi:hypothetical protein
MTHLEIVKKLIGDIRPIGKSEVDAERFENLKAMCKLADAVGFDFRNDKEGSIRKCSDYAQKFMTETMGINQ